MFLVCNLIIFLFRISAKKSALKMAKVGLEHAVSKQKFNFLSSQAVQDLKKVTLKKRTFAKMIWGVNAYFEWLRHNYNAVIAKANLLDLDNLEKLAFEEAMCYFIPEVMKSKGEGLYPGKMLYEMCIMCICIQKYLNVNRVDWKIVESDQFLNLRTVLDNVMKERAALNIGLVPKQAQLISYEFEEKL